MSTSALELGDRHRSPRRRRARRLSRHDRLDVAAGRARGAAHAAASAAVMVATSAPMDQFMATHPDYLLRRAARARADQSREPVHPGEPPQVRAPSSCRSREDERFGGDVRRASWPRWRRRACCTGRAALSLDVGDLSGRPHLAAHGHLRQLPGDRHHRARREADQAAPDHRRGRLEQRVRDDLSQGDLHGGGRALRGPGAPLPRGRGEGGLRQARGGGLLHRRHQRQGRLDPPAPRAGRRRPA